MIIFTRNLVVKDFWLKAFSLALAILIWLTVKFNFNGESPTSPLLALIGRPPDETVLTVPIHMPSGTAEPDRVRVNLRGNPQALKNLKPQDVRAEVDLSGVESANGLFRPVEIILPKGISYTRVEPEEVAIFSKKPE